MTMIWSPKPGIEFTLVKETMDECDLLTEVNYSCPIKQGEYVFHRLGKVPSVLPQVKMSYYALKHTNLHVTTNFSILAGIVQDFHKVHNSEWQRRVLWENKPGTYIINTS